MEGWSRSNGHLVAELSQQEAAVVRGLVGQIKDMLVARAGEAPQDELAEMTGIRTGPSAPPEDRVLGRLLPDFVRTDMDTGSAVEPPNGSGEDDASALRSLHEPEVLDAKTAVADLVLNTCPVDGGAVRLTEDQADGWMSALNDVRLALGTALDVSEDDEDAEQDAEMDELRQEHLGIYHWLTWVQDSLISTLMG